MDSPHKIGTEGLLRPGAHFSASTTIFPPENGAALANEQEDSAGGDGGYALVINGDSLGHALKKKYEKTFLEIGCSCVVSGPTFGYKSAHFAVCHLLPCDTTAESPSGGLGEA